jgi:hypothetical protein
MMSKASKLIKLITLHRPNHQAASTRFIANALELFVLFRMRRRKDYFARSATTCGQCLFNRIATINPLPA